MTRASLIAGLTVALCAQADPSTNAQGDRPPQATAQAAKGACMIPGEFKTLWPDPDGIIFAPTTLQEREAFEALIPSLVRASAKQKLPPDAAVAKASSIGFVIDVWDLGAETFWALREREDARRGAGAYVFRTGEAQNVVLQAPHVFFDLGTETIGAQLFTCAPEGFRPRVFLTNTAHRYKGRAGERRDDPDHPADLAHNPDHLFQVATDAVVRSVPDVRIVQLHGFGPSESKREEVAAVISAGTRSPGVLTRKVATRLTSVLGEGIRVFPDDTDRLGGTKNAQGRLLQAYPKARFVHLELSAPLRRALRGSTHMSEVAKALFAPEEE